MPNNPDLERCDREIAACLAYVMGDHTPDLAGALLGFADWHAERKRIVNELQLDTTTTPAAKISNDVG